MAFRPSQGRGDSTSRGQPGRRERVMPPGMTPEVFNSVQQILSGYQGNGSMDDLMRHLTRSDPSGSMLQGLMGALEDAEGANPVDLDAVDYKALRVRPRSFWIVQLEHMGFQDTHGRVEQHASEGAAPAFQIFIYDDRGSCRVAEGNTNSGLPTSNFVLNTIKKAMGAPMPPLQPELPELMIIARKLGVHVSALAPFLDTLPAPFSWRLETPEEEEDVASGVHAKNAKGVADALRAAEHEKELGNKAFARRDRAQAVARYTEAIECLRDAAAQKPANAEESKIKTTMAVCRANRAAAWLLPGAGRDPRKALDDAEEAIAQDPGYGKGYYRKAKAQQLLSQTSAAIDTLIGALKRPTLAGEMGLSDLLVELFGGFPENAEELKAFCLDKFRSDEGDKRARGIEESRRRAEIQLKKVCRPDVSIETL